MFQSKHLSLVKQQSTLLLGLVLSGSLLACAPPGQVASTEANGTADEAQIKAHAECVSNASYTPLESERGQGLLDEAMKNDQFLKNGSHLLDKGCIELNYAPFRGRTMTCTKPDGSSYSEEQLMVAGNCWTDASGKGNPSAQSSVMYTRPITGEDAGSIGAFVIPTTNVTQTANQVWYVLTDQEGVTSELNEAELSTPSTGGVTSGEAAGAQAAQQQTPNFPDTVAGKACEKAYKDAEAGAGWGQIWPWTLGAGAAGYGATNLVAGWLTRGPVPTTPGSAPAAAKPAAATTVTATGSQGLPVNATGTVQDRLNRLKPIIGTYGDDFVDKLDDALSNKKITPKEYNKLKNAFDVDRKIANERIFELEDMLSGRRPIVADRSARIFNTGRVRRPTQFTLAEGDILLNEAKDIESLGKKMFSGADAFEPRLLAAIEKKAGTVKAPSGAVAQAAHAAEKFCQKKPWICPVAAGLVALAAGSTAAVMSQRSATSSLETQLYVTCCQAGLVAAATCAQYGVTPPANSGGGAGGNDLCGNGVIDTVNVDLGGGQTYPMPEACDHGDPAKAYADPDQIKNLQSALDEAGKPIIKSSVDVPANGTYKNGVKCAADCSSFTFCGDGKTDPAKQCDKGEDNGKYAKDVKDACGFDCTTATAKYCGNDKVEDKEECDPGSDFGKDKADRTPIVDAKDTSKSNICNDDCELEAIDNNGNNNGGGGSVPPVVTQPQPPQTVPPQPVVPQAPVVASSKDSGCSVNTQAASASHVWLLMGWVAVAGYRRRRKP